MDNIQSYLLGFSYMYDRKCYKRRKRGFLKKAQDPSTEEFEAFEKIREKWHFTDLKISKLLKENTVTEILEGEMTPNGFIPRELIFISKCLLVSCLIAGLFYIKIHHDIPCQIVAFISNLP